MSTVRAEREVAAALATVAGAVRSATVLTTLPGHARVQVSRRAGLLVAGDLVSVRARWLPAVGLPAVGLRPVGLRPVGLRVHQADLHHTVLRWQRGPLRDLAVTVALRPTAAGTRVVVEVQAPLGPRAHRRAQAVLGEWVGHVAAAADRMAAAREVVAGAVITDGRLLVAQRRYPPALAGQWELAGGAVEPGESPPQALVRELDEELGVVVEPGERVGADVPLADGRVLRAYRARLVQGPAQAREHAALRWVGAGQLSRLDLVVNDRGWRPELVPLLVE